jgi:N-acetylmuramoyl-L-alanine amidase
MWPGFLRCAAGAALLAAAAAAVAAPMPGVRLAGADYVGLDAAAAALGLRASSTVFEIKFSLADASHRLAFEADQREAWVDGLRVFLGAPALMHDGRPFLSRIDVEHRLLPMIRPGLGGPPPAHPHVIALDPGHGGSDPGMQNFRLGMMEKTYTLDVALRLKRLLELQGDRVVLTRSDDRQLGPDKESDLKARAEIANLAHADLFISIHFNAVANDTRTNGSEVYTFPPQFQRSSDSWSRHQDDSDREFSPVNRQDVWSVVLAHALHRELISRLHTVDRGEKLRHLGVLRALQCPGVLIESAFLSNDAEARRVATPAFQQEIAAAMLAGINDYAATLDALRPAPPPHP